MQVDDVVRVVGALVTVLGSCAGAVYGLWRYQRTFVDAQDDEISGLRQRLDALVDQLDTQRRDHESELAETRRMRAACEAENNRLFDELAALRRTRADEVSRLEGQLLTLRRQFAEALERRELYTAGDNPGTRDDDE